MGFSRRFTNTETSRAERRDMPIQRLLTVRMLRGVGWIGLPGPLRDCSFAFDRKPQWQMRNGIRFRCWKTWGLKEAVPPSPGFLSYGVELLRHSEFDGSGYIPNVRAFSGTKGVYDTHGTTGQIKFVFSSNNSNFLAYMMISSCRRIRSHRARNAFESEELSG